MRAVISILGVPDQDILVWKNTLVLPEEPDKEAATLEGSLVGFSSNGQFQGIAYR